MRESSCTSIQCCLDPPRLHRKLEFSLVLDDCAYRLTTSIENLVLTRSLSGFDFGKYNFCFVLCLDSGNDIKTLNVILSN